MGYLYRLASLYSSRRWLAVAFPIAAVYPSFVWHYLRASTLEGFQLFFFVAYVTHVVAYARAATERDGGGRRASTELLAASCAAGFLFLLRPTFGVLPPLSVGMAILAGAEAPIAVRIRDAVRSGLRRVVTFALIPAVAAGGISCWVNVVKTGSPLDTGYAQWLGPDGLPANRLTLAALPGTVRGFFVDPGNYNVFLHQPLLLLAALGLPEFLRRYRAEARALLVVGITSILPILFVSNWNGEWFYGPRYLVHPLLVLCVPAVLAVERIAG